MDFSQLNEEEIENFVMIATTFGTVTLEDTIIKCCQICYDLAEELQEFGEATLVWSKEPQVEDGETNAN